MDSLRISLGDSRMVPSDMEFVKIKVACQILGVSPNTLRSWGAAGKVTEYRHPINNYRLFKRAEIEMLREILTNPQPRESKRK